MSRRIGISVLTLLIVFLGPSLRFIISSEPEADQPPTPTAPCTVAMPVIQAYEPPPEPPEEGVCIGQYFDRFAGQPGESSASWPHFLGPQHDGINHESLHLASPWPPGGPRLLWSIDLHDGHSSPVVHRGRVFLMDYDPKTRAEMLRCFSLDSGRELWRRWHTIRLINNHGYLHTSAVASDCYVVGIGAKGHLMCLDPETGDFRWGANLRDRFGSRINCRFNVQSPLIDGTTVVVAIGSPDVLLAGFDAGTGTVLWKSPNPRSGDLSFSSVIPAVVQQRPVYLYATMQGTFAFDARRNQPGSLVWQVQADYHDVPSPVPVVLDDGLVFLTGGYGRGSTLVRVDYNRNERPLPSIWGADYREGFSTDAHVPLNYHGHLFAILPEGSTRRSQFACMDPLQKGGIRWSSGKEHRFGPWEPFTLADGKFYVMKGDGVLTMIRASTERYEELGQALVLPNSVGWHPTMAICGGRLLVRDERRMVCLDLRN